MIKHRHQYDRKFENPNNSNNNNNDDDEPNTLMFEYRILFYLFTIIIGSMFNDFNHKFKYLSILKLFKYSNPNLIHDLFVKSGWIYIIFIAHSLLIFISCAIICKIHFNLRKHNEYNRQQFIRFNHHQSSMNIGNNDNDPIIAKLFDHLYNYIYNKLKRLSLFIIIWFSTQEFYDYYQSLTNLQNVNSSNKLAYIFDISGHVHILLLSNIFLQQECYFLRKYLQLKHQLKQQQQSHQQPIKSIEKLSINSLQPINYDSNHIEQSIVQNSDDDEYDQQFDSICKFISILMQTISIIWDLLFIQTAFFYHTLIEKLISFIWTIYCCHLLNSI